MVGAFFFFAGAFFVAGALFFPVVFFTTARGAGVRGVDSEGAGRGAPPASPYNRR